MVNFIPPFLALAWIAHKTVLQVMEMPHWSAHVQTAIISDQEGATTMNLVV